LRCLDPGAAAAPMYSAPRTESFVYLVEGVAKVELSGGRVFTLNRGDSACYRADEFEGMSNAGDSRCVFVWVQAPARLDLP
jgi:quercetin dioxygenase-like cupin family protein